MAQVIKYDDITSVRLPTGYLEIAEKLAVFEGVKPADIFRRGIVNEMRAIQEAMEEKQARKAARKVA